MSAVYDVVIVGAGMVGATLAAALSENANLKIALIEAKLPPQLPLSDPYDNRVSALTQTSEHLLKQFGIWAELFPERISSFTDMHVWETDNSQLHYDASEMNKAYLGHIVENRHLQLACLSFCEHKTNINLITPAHPIGRVDRQLELSNGLTLEADLIVAADGAQSKLRTWSGIQTKGWSYQQKALVATVTTEKPHQLTAWQRFLPEGPLAFLPLPDAHQCSIVWSVKESTADELLNSETSLFLSQLSDAYQYKLGEVLSVKDLAAFPLQLKHAETYIQPHFALVGDAAHTIHPIAGQGVNIGLLDAIALKDVIDKALSQNRPIGSVHTLKKYQRARRADNLMMQFSMDLFKRSFSSNLSPVRKLRQFGLQQVDKTPFLKQFFIDQAASRSFAKPMATDEFRD